MSFFTKIKDKTHRTLIAGPGDKLKIIEIMNPSIEINRPNIDDLIIAILKLVAWLTPNKVGVDKRAITSRVCI